MNWRNIYLSIALIGIGLYLNTLGHDYTVDDTTVIKNNRFTTQGLAGIDEIFSSSYRAGYWDRKEGQRQLVHPARGSSARIEEGPPRLTAVLPARPLRAGV